MEATRLDLGVFELGEGPVWDAETSTLTWVDITPGEVHTWSPSTGERTVVRCGQEVGSAARRVGGGLVCALREGVAVVDEGSEDLQWIAKGIMPSTHRFNDAKVDARGRLWAGATALEFGSGPGALYRIDPDGQARVMLETVQFSNGMGWSPDGETMYLIDSLASVLFAYDFDADAGLISGARRLVHFSPADGFPDGLAVDAEGHVWVARYGVGAVDRFDPEGERVQRVKLGATQPTCPGFGDPTTGTMYVATARQFLDEEQLTDDEGALFSIDAGVAGVPTHRFAG